MAEPESGPVDPSIAQGAQIPLQTFTLPHFPPEASHLRALTLTSDIKLDEYTQQLETFSAIPPLPQEIQSLTLELFSLGYPPGFLTALATALPNIKSFDAYSQLLCGITPESQADAVAFFAKCENLRAAHLLDVFARPGFFAEVGEKLAAREKGLLFLQFNYTYRHEDEEFLSRIPAGELPLLIGPSLVMCSFNIAAPETTDDPEDPTNLTCEGADLGGAKPEGVMAFHKSCSDVLVGRLTDGKTKPKALKVLNTTLYTLVPADLEKILREQKDLLVLNATVEVEPTEECKQKLLGALELCPLLEQVEIVANPSLAFSMAVMNPRHQALSKAFPSAQDMDRLSKSCERLSKFSATVLRTTTVGEVKWDREGGVWNGGVSQPEPPSSSTGMPSELQDVSAAA
ncbi:hypothetical protein K490DRAFT_54264 [Saccharata proteae CBS 121410]|uniref:Uncharacterized protein n=1 Tax=Saccharata proteae CBS 121410 TaxID=1314787 RepID=A0A9P4HVC5_9PEZI|nr:hypothetical protein K490DRAFT_54264 [Saccharata proteae CBS 121410]